MEEQKIRLHKAQQLNAITLKVQFNSEFTRLELSSFFWLQSFEEMVTCGANKQINFPDSLTT